MDKHVHVYRKICTLKPVLYVNLGHVWWRIIWNQNGLSITECPFGPAHPCSEGRSVWNLSITSHTQQPDNCDTAPPAAGALQKMLWGRVEMYCLVYLKEQQYEPCTAKCCKKIQNKALWGFCSVLFCSVMTEFSILILCVLCTHCLICH